MARIVTLDQASLLSGQLKHWAYNAVDCVGTREVFDTLSPMLDADQRRIYLFHMGVQNPVFSMMRRGALVDVERRKAAVRELETEWKRAIKAMNKLPAIREVWDGTEKETGHCQPKPDGSVQRHKWPRGIPDDPTVPKACERCGTGRWKPSPFNPNSPKQVDHLFYGLHKVPPMKNKKGEQSVDESVLERIGKRSAKLKELTDAILNIRDLRKQIGTLNARLTPDGRFPSSFNVAAAWTGRFSSSKNPMGYGGNLQNVPERLRSFIIADPGQELCYADLEQAESRTVAYISGDEEYIAAHIAGDVHTYATRLIWPQLPWTGDLKKDKAIAKQNPPWDLAPGHEYRFQAKRIQHGGNYGLSPNGISLIAHIPLSEARAAYDAYHAAFPRIRAWHRATAMAISAQEPLVNPVGFKVRLFGRPWDPHTLKQGLALKPQSLVAFVVNIALWLVWKELEPLGVQLLAQVHDALLFQVPKGKRELVKAVMERMLVPVVIGDRTMVIPTEATVGQNWGKRDAKNPYGLEVFHP